MCDKTAIIPARKEKHLRVQGPRSQRGCQTCKLRHVKCDEALPICGGCLRLKKPCHYVGKKVDVSDTKFIVYSLPKEPELFLKLPITERRALWHFEHRTLEQVEGCFRSPLWSTIVPRLIHDDLIVRQAAMALSAFHEHYLDHSAAGLSLPDDALRCYQKAQHRIIELESPDGFFDSILCACIIFCVCEGLRGDFEEAIRHAMAGMKIIAARKNAPNPPRASMLESTEDVLSNLFLSLSNQVMEANVDHGHITYPGLDQKMASVPGSFKDVEEALPYLQTILNELLQLYHSAETHHEQHTWIRSQVSPFLQIEYETVRAKYEAWAAGVEQLQRSAQSGDRRKQAGWLLLKIYTLFIGLNLYVFVHGEESYDELKATNFTILGYVESFLDIHPDTIGPKYIKNEPDTSAPTTRLSSSFTNSPEIIPVVFEIATRTGDPILRQKAVQILRSSARREGIWDGKVSASLAEKIVELKHRGTVAAKALHPGRKFLIADIIPLSEQKYEVRYGFKKIQEGAFNSFWLETIREGQGVLQTQILNLE